jgi:pimeloyl-ACP methyl ester carboxylesterase
MGSRLEEEQGYTPLYLRYNTGCHISTNGREFSQVLAELCDAWPVPVESLSLIGHSMGGLVIRSACHYAQAEKRAWVRGLKRILFLGTPHHGAPLEQAGHAFDRVVERLPYLAPLALGRHRSAGVKDLRHGNLLDEDWSGVPPDQAHRDHRKPVPLPPGVNHYFAVATLGRHLQDPLGELAGDLLVRVGSALGSHGNARKRLPIDPGNCQVFHQRNHFDLLDDGQVHDAILRWFSS